MNPHISTTGLALSRFSAGYPKRQVIRDLTVPRLPRGEITALLGPNGSGKSTLMRAMAGLGPSTGELSFDGENLLALPFARRAEKVVYLPQTLPAGVHLHVLESIIVAQRAAGGVHDAQSQQQVMSLLRQLGITAVYVTHDRREAELLADKIIHLSAGCIAAVRAVTSTSGESV